MKDTELAENGAKESVLEVRGLCKRYPAFELRDVSFSLRRGHITGFIGRNGAGKSTTLKSLLGFVHPDAGEISFLGRQVQELNKEQIGFVSGGVQYYRNQKLSGITAVTRQFYHQWDQEAYAGCLRRFELDEQKTPAQLSAGMQVKYAIALALSHRAELLILDEPTSGLDPVSREDLLELFLQLCGEGKTILFSTHITSDLERCADDILYIRRGQIRAEQPIEAFVNGYRLVHCTKEQAAGLGEQLIGARMERDGCRALVRAQDAEKLIGVTVSKADLESVMVHLEKEGN